MRHFSKLLILFLLLVGINSMQAQDENNPWQIQFGVNGVDASISNNNPFVTNPVMKASSSLDVIPSISYVALSYHVGKGFSFGARSSFNKIRNISDEKVDVSHYNVDGIVKYNFLKNTAIDPFAEIGPGYTWISRDGAFTANGGLGINFWFSDHVGFTVEGIYKKTLKNQGITHLQYLAGLSFKFRNNTDTDKDGVYDKDDACPKIPGLKAFKGCPDTDGDGITDNKDACPKVAGSKEMNGCPDTDGDGIADNNDACPKVAGPMENKGCPWTDKDGDGVLDKDDLCPDAAGPVSNKGCPEMTKKVQKKLNDFAKVILFDFNKSTIKTSSTSLMLDIVQILEKYPNSKFTIEGHTDSVGASNYNQKLSESRANSVQSFLIDKGIPSSRLTAIGYGESKPISTNRTREGRRKNRRVEINLIK